MNGDQSAWLRSLLGGIVLIGLVTIALVMAGGPAAFEQWMRGTLQPWLEANPTGAPLIFVLAYALVTVLLLSTSVMNFIAGAVFGPFVGLFWALTGLMLGTVLAFVMARYLAADWVERKLPLRVSQLKSGIERNGVLYVAIARIVPFVPYSAANYGFGLTKISLPTFLVTSAIFIIPRVFGWVYTGHAGRMLLVGDVRLSTALLALTLGLGILLVTLALPALWFSSHGEPDRQPPTWHFTLLAPVYDLLMTLRSPKPIDDRIRTLEGPTILDIGGGTGALVLDLPESITYGLVDRNEAMLRESKDRPGSVIRVLGDARSLPLKDRSWDHVVMRDALHHMGEPTRVLAEIERILNPGGTVVLEEFNPSTWTGRALELFERGVGMESRFFPPEELRRRLNQAGLEVEEEVHSGMTELFIARRPG